jgi:hypothetical protein
MKNFKLLVLFAALSSVSAEAQIQMPNPVSTRPIPGCNVPKIGGDKVPFPLRNANSKFELAENETYLLNGHVMQNEGKLYFKVDFETQPWLATAKRVQFPYFLISAEDASEMKGVSNELVQMAVIARKADVSSQNQEWSNGIVLNVITRPVRITK